MQVIFITGASSGIGKALAEYYADSAVTLGLLALHSDKLADVADKCRKRGAVVHEYCVDVTDRKNMDIAIEDFLSVVDSVDIVIANAGILIPEKAGFNNVDDAERTIRTNFLGVMNTFEPFLAHMTSRRQGQLVAISSISSIRGTQNSGLYSASKAAVNLWTESLRLRLKSFNIPVTTICLGFVATPMTQGITFAMPGILSADEAARRIAAGIRAKKRQYVLPWQSTLIWGLFRIMPGWLYDYLICKAKERQQIPRQ